MKSKSRTLPELYLEMSAREPSIQMLYYYTNFVLRDSFWWRLCGPESKKSLLSREMDIKDGELEEKLLFSEQYERLYGVS